MKDNFKKLKRKLLLEAIGLIVMSVILGAIFLHLFVDGVLESWFAEGFVTWLQNWMGLDYYAARQIYLKIFVYNKPMILGGAFLLLLGGALYVMGMRLTRYYQEMAQAVHKLLDESDEPIVMSDGLEFMTTELNEVKRVLKHRERVARESEQRKNDLVMYLAHDIKTPLTSIIGYLSLLEESQELPSTFRQKYTGICLDKSYRLETLINEFFEITRFNIHEVVLEKETFNLTFMMEQLVDEFYPLLLEKNLKINLMYEEEVEFYGDVDKLVRVFNNLLKNAVAYSYPQSIIELHIFKTVAEVTLTFKNQGKTIPKHKLETIFEKFYRLDTSRTSQTGGSGLGLAIAKEIVVAHKGTIEVESSEAGTIFTIKLPYSK